MDIQITNVQQLRARIAVLEVRKAEDELYFHQRISSFKEKISKPFRFVKSVFNAVAFGDVSGINLTGRADWATHLGRIILPLVMNRTLLRGKGVWLKAIFSLFSQKAINPAILNKDIVSHWIDNATSFIKSKTKKKEKRYGTDDYGIPPESETA